MKNITVSVDEAVHRNARLRAAERNTSVSALVKQFLIELSAGGSEAEHKRHRQNALLARLDANGKGLQASDRCDRGALHERG